MNEIQETAQAYTKGALVGGVIFAAFALITRRRVLLWTTIGAIGGGFVAHSVRSSKKEVVKTKFKNYDLESKSSKQ